MSVRNALFPLTFHASLICLASLLAGACSPVPDAPGSGTGKVSGFVEKINVQLAKSQDFSDPASFSDARRGFIAAPNGQVKDETGRVIWDYDSFAFLQGEAPASVHPALWRQSLLNNHVGLFKVTDGIWQLRGFDLANMTLIQGKTGWIVVDPLTTAETASAAIAFARKHLGVQAVSAVVFTHSHADHFGGALGVISAQELAAKKIPVIAPAGFMEEASSENILMGNAMGIRAGLMYGGRLPRNAEGLVDNGLGKAVAFGTIGLLPPTELVTQAQQRLAVDGVDFIFHTVSGSEAPAEFTFELPAFGAYCGSELMSHTLHNLYTLRGAKVRDALKWSDYLGESLEHAASASVVFNSHHWPVWGQANIANFISKQRDVYRYIHDQTVRQMNAGLTASDIAETLQLPASLQNHLNVRGYYGTVKHNVRAVYQHYLGWFDANPANLDPLPPVEAGRRYVALAGGAEKVRQAAQTAYDKGDFRWAAELLKHAVYADAKDTAARELLARSFEQMGFLAESTAWRNFYLTGAVELRDGPAPSGIDRKKLVQMLQYTPIERFLEAMAASLNGSKAADHPMVINLSFTDLNQNYVLQIENGVLHFKKTAPSPQVDASLSLTKAFFLKMMTGEAGAKDLLLSDQTKITGSQLSLLQFFSMLEKPPTQFSVVSR